MTTTHEGEQPDKFCDDGITKKLNKSRPHGVTYGAHETVYVQDGIAYRGDGTPVGYVSVKPASPKS